MQHNKNRKLLSRSFLNVDSLVSLHMCAPNLVWFAMESYFGQFVCWLAIAGLKVSSTRCEGYWYFWPFMSGFVQICHEGSFFLKKDKLLFLEDFWSTKWKIEGLGGKISKLEDILQIGGHLCPMYRTLFVQRTNISHFLKFCGSILGHGL